MQKDDCCDFEQALAAETELDERLRQHADGCPRCRALAQVAGLAARPAASKEGDALLTSLHSLAAAIARQRAARWERRSRIVPLLIGLAGYLVAAGTLVLALLSERGGVAVPQPIEVSLAVVPPPNPTLIMSVLAAAIIWITVVAFFTRSRRTWLEAETSG
jgi:hypothetical protein